MITVITLLILMNIIYIGAIIWCVRSMRKTNPTRKAKKQAKVIRLQLDKIIARELDKKLSLDYEIIQSC